MNIDKIRTALDCAEIFVITNGHARKANTVLGILQEARIELIMGGVPVKPDAERLDTEPSDSVDTIPAPLGEALNMESPPTKMQCPGCGKTRPLDCGDGANWFCCNSVGTPTRQIIMGDAAIRKDVDSGTVQATSVDTTSPTNDDTDLLFDALAEKIHQDEIIKHLRIDLARAHGLIVELGGITGRKV